MPRRVTHLFQNATEEAASQGARQGTRTNARRKFSQKDIENMRQGGRRGDTATATRQGKNRTTVNRTNVENTPVVRPQDRRVDPRDRMPNPQQNPEQFNRTGNAYTQKGREQLNEEFRRQRSQGGTGTGPRPNTGAQQQTGSNTSSTGGAQGTGGTNPNSDYVDTSNLTGSGRMNAFGGMYARNFENSLKEGQGMFGAIAGDVGRGALAGGAIGGTVEASQGGSFWDGAITGATRGGAGWGAYRGMMRGTGATSRNPFSQQGAFRQGATMNRATSANPDVSRPAQALLSQNQRESLSSAVVNYSRTK